jgi:hypothetical protein
MRSLSFSSLVCWLARIFYLFFLLEKGTKRAKRLAFFLSATKKEKKKKIRTSRRSREIFLSFRQEVRRKGRAFLPFLPPARDVLRLAPEKEEKPRACNQNRANTARATFTFTNKTENWTDRIVKISLSKNKSKARAFNRTS